MDNLPNVSLCTNCSRLTNILSLPGISLRRRSLVVVNLAIAKLSRLFSKRRLINVVLPAPEGAENEARDNSSTAIETGLVKSSGYPPLRGAGSPTRIRTSNIAVNSQLSRHPHYRPIGSPNPRTVRFQVPQAAWSSVHESSKSVAIYQAVLRPILS